MAEPIVVESPTEEDTEQEDEENANVTESLQKEKGRSSAHFDINKDLPERCGYRLRDTIHCKVTPIDDYNNELIMLQHCMDQEFCPIADIFMTQFNPKQGLKQFCQIFVSAIEK